MATLSAFPAWAGVTVKLSDTMVNMRDIARVNIRRWVRQTELLTPRTV